MIAGKIFLTETELKVYGTVLTGEQVEEMGARLNMKGKAVKFHLTNIFKKFGVKSRVQLVALVRSREAVLMEGAAVDRFASRLEVLKLDEQAKELELVKRLAKYRTGAEITAAWPAVLQSIRIHPDSKLGLDILNALLKELRLGI